MDSEIKLRAWDRDNKKMIYFDGITFWEDNKFWGQTENNQSLWRGTYKNLILMQYTGLKDKNEKEIYEGDIIKGYEMPQQFPFVIKWDKTLAGFRFPYCFSLSEIEIIGNIYENKELIKEV